ncbi:uncharacterized protein DS421_19g652870 [Arachis hypogaea]|uniref:Uncharacterized protein n=1 Tax=Arachis hypogaea TaxID=3818 RepID=A0A6B9V7Q8_ARAHY|nr:uncharacterized protein DS421_19g652870 [Arachis hypogaea]
MQQLIGQRQTLKWSSVPRRISPWPVGLGDTVGNQKKKKNKVLPNLTMFL